MKVVLQACNYGSVEINNEIVGKIENGYVCLVGFTNGDDKEIVNKMIDKIIKLRVFPDENGKMNLSLIDKDYSILSISQFTLYADTFSGRRPSFTNALNPIEAKELYEYFNNQLKNNNIHIETGQFGADMLVTINNTGPCTIILDSKEF